MPSNLGGIIMMPSGQLQGTLQCIRPAWQGTFISSNIFPYIESLENLFKSVSSAECSLQGSFGSEETENGSRKSRMGRE